MNKQSGERKFAAAIARAALPGAICAAVCGVVAALLIWDSSKAGALVCLAIGIAAGVLSVLIPQIPAVTAAMKLGALERVATNSKVTGDIRIPDNIREAIRLHDNGDEISDVCKAMVAVLDSYMEKVLILEQVAQGDLSTRVRTAGESDTLGNAINEVLANTSRVVQEVKVATAQFSAGVRELANGAQSLAQSSSEKATTVDQLQISVGDIAAEAETNAARAAEASKLTAAIRESAGYGRKQVENMSASIREIAAANHSIGSVMHTIDDIAFQTNILALNAAVEAARAGVHGRGFAVVADEVRNLANKSGSAASESNAVIVDTIAKSDDGLKAVEDVLTFFHKIEDGIANTSSLLDEIAVTAKNQSDSIDTINDFIVNLTNVVLLNNATSEQSAAASEEMASRAIILEESVNRFKLEEDRSPVFVPEPPPEPRPESYPEPYPAPPVVTPQEAAPDPLPASPNPINEPVPEAGGRTPAEIYAEALGKKASAEVPLEGFKNDESKYW
ncbi:MAG: methyl-accepting chemotaxis protein [Clostridiales Family XIII bacterium]|jgi:methyl-accepting chemotaxis protein|nr:methyl-accepting chemotaxis protein [Clostridiales Family XIII bacterium]